MIKLNPAESSSGHDSLVQSRSTDIDENHGLVILNPPSPLGETPLRLSKFNPFLSLRLPGRSHGRRLEVANATVAISGSLVSG